MQCGDAKERESNGGLSLGSDLQSEVARLWRGGGKLFLDPAVKERLSFQGSVAVKWMEG